MQQLKTDSVFIISPFREVAYQFKDFCFDQKAQFARTPVKHLGHWVEHNIGTVHTFQGKEAKAVILLLGAQSEQDLKGRRWATDKVNLLNVAISRAQQYFYIVGNHALWHKVGHMKTISHSIPIKKA